MKLIERKEMKYVEHIGRNNFWICAEVEDEAFGLTSGVLGYFKRTQPELLILDVIENFLGSGNNREEIK